MDNYNTNMSCKKCIENNKKIERMQIKMKKCKEMLDDLMEDVDFNEIERNNYKVIEEMGMDGHKTKKIHTDLGETMYYIEDGQDLSELDRKEYNAITAQDSLKKFETTHKIYKNTSNAWGFGSAVYTIGRFVTGFL